MIAFKSTFGFRVLSVVQVASYRAYGAFFIYCRSCNKMAGIQYK